jgi:hypothetical protein
MTKIIFDIVFETSTYPKRDKSDNTHLFTQFAAQINNNESSQYHFLPKKTAITHIDKRQYLNFLDNWNEIG